MIYNTLLNAGPCIGHGFLVVADQAALRVVLFESRDEYRKGGVAALLDKLITRGVHVLLDLGSRGRLLVDEL